MYTLELHNIGIEFSGDSDKTDCVINRNPLPSYVIVDGHGCLP